MTFRLHWEQAYGRTAPSGRIYTNIRSPQVQGFHFDGDAVLRHPSPQESPAIGFVVTRANDKNSGGDSLLVELGGRQRTRLGLAAEDNDGIGLGNRRLDDEDGAPNF